MSRPLSNLRERHMCHFTNLKKNIAFYFSLVSRITVFFGRTTLVVSFWSTTLLHRDVTTRVWPIFEYIRVIFNMNINLNHICIIFYTNIFGYWKCESENVKVWKEKCESESERVKVWKLKCESESVKAKVWNWKCESECVKVWKWKCESKSAKRLGLTSMWSSCLPYHFQPKVFYSSCRKQNQIKWYLISITYLVRSM